MNAARAAALLAGAALMFSCTRAHGVRSCVVPPSATEVLEAEPEREYPPYTVTWELNPGLSWGDYEAWVGSHLPAEFHLEHQDKDRFLVWALREGDRWGLEYSRHGPQEPVHTVVRLAIYPD